ncbi:hypothetical protein CEUSTIGMA_g2157.t1 [Chlamydomonas eustigma]|uniref:RING-type domain-containing protein n=1 Tax=Chlamydomonas eustigma TaxID=1157962 RepID=A0A250WVH6_9CHLO|nr:hypothetical protein CEUSTIGMA_g2157.t1 [Chlamydomonas eustigma]|eukprot:GAX74709.1 hypothetical protein CEUSTIGMA_g2157.t1 [Chlamydomonas eustigma]
MTTLGKFINIRAFCANTCGISTSHMRPSKPVSRLCLHIYFYVRYLSIEWWTDLKTYVHLPGYMPWNITKLWMRYLRLCRCPHFTPNTPFPPRFPASYSPIPSPAQNRMNITLVSGIIVGVLGGMLLLVLARGYYIRSAWQQQVPRTDVEIGRSAWATQAGFLTDPAPPVTDHAPLNSSVPEHIIATFPVRIFSMAKAPATKSAFDLALASSFRVASEGISALRSAVSASVLGKPAGSVSLVQGRKASTILMMKGDSLDVKDGNAAPLLLEVGESNVVQNIDVGSEGSEAIGQSNKNSNAGTGLVAAHEQEIFRVSRGMPSGRKIISISSPVVPQCAICLGDFEHGQEVRRLPCFHDFHKECIDGWMSQHRTCPLCRHVLYDPASDYDAAHQYPVS